MINEPAAASDEKPDRPSEDAAIDTTPVDTDQETLTQARSLAGTTSDRDTVDLALRTLIAVLRRQPTAVETIIGRRFDADQIDAPTLEPAPVGGNEGESTTATDPRERARVLTAALGSTLVAALAGEKDSRAAESWATGNGPTPSPWAAERLRFAAEQWRRVASAEDPDTARAWFIGANPRLQDDTPVNAIREGRFTDVSRAVQALVDDSFGG